MATYFLQLGGREGKVKRNGEIPPAPSLELKADVKRLAWQKLQVTSATVSLKMGKEISNDY